MTAKGAQNRKRKLSDSAVVVPQGKKTKFSTPQPQQKAKTPQSALKKTKVPTPQQTPKGKKGGVTPKQNVNSPSAVFKAQPTPKGKKTGPNQKNLPKGGTPARNGKPKTNSKASPEDSDDEDDEEDEDVGLSVQKNSSSKLFAGQLQEDDDDDEDDDEEDDVDDEEDDDDEEEEDDDEEEEEDDDEEEIAAPPAKKKVKTNNQSELNNKKTLPVLQNKSQEASKQSALSKKDTSISKKGDNNKTVPSGDADRLNDRDVRTLFVKNLPKDCSIKQLKAMSKDIKQVRIRAKTTYNSKSKKKERSGFAYLEFDSEAAAERNFKNLQTSYIEGQQLIVDYVGEKSQHAFAKKKVEVAEYDPQKLYIAGLAEDVVEADLRKLFPKASNVILPRARKGGKLFGYGFVQFSNERDAKMSHDKMQDHKLKGITLIVLFAKKWKRDEKMKEKQQKLAKKAEAKKQSKEETSMDVDESGDDEEGDDDDKEEESIKKAVKGNKKTPVNQVKADDEEDDDDEDDDEDDEEDDDDEDDDEEEEGDD